MTNYEKLYFHTRNRCTDIIEEVKDLQREVEELYLQNAEDTNGHSEQAALAK